MLILESNSMKNITPIKRIFSEGLTTLLKLSFVAISYQMKNFPFGKSAGRFLPKSPQINNTNRIINMKKKLSLFLLIAFLSGSILISCDSSAKKVEDAREDVQTSKESVAEANIHLSQAVQDSTNDYRQFRTESEQRIAGYEKNIAELKVKISQEKKEGKSKYQKLLKDLEEEVAYLKQNLKEYKEDGNDKWIAFKTKFNSNMDDLGKSISNFFSKEKK